MAGSTTRNRFALQDLGSNVDTWGVDVLNPAFERIDESMDGVVKLVAGQDSVAILTTAGTGADQARQRILWVTGAGVTGFTIRIPVGQKWYWVANRNAAPIVVTNGTNSATVPTGLHAVVSDGIDVYLPVIAAGATTPIQVLAGNLVATPAIEGRVVLGTGSVEMDGPTMNTARTGGEYTIKAQGGPVDLAYTDASALTPIRRGITLAALEFARLVKVPGGYVPAGGRQ